MRYEAHNFMNRPGRRITKVTLNGRDVTQECHACDPEEGWVKVFERTDPANPRSPFLKIYENGKPIGISTVTLRSRVEVTFSDHERICTGDQRHPDALRTIEAIASGKNLIEPYKGLSGRIL